MTRPSFAPSARIASRTGCSPQMIRPLTARSHAASSRQGHAGLAGDRARGGAGSAASRGWGGRPRPSRPPGRSPRRPSSCASDRRRGSPTPARTPGVTSVAPGPSTRRRSAASCGEQTNPRTPSCHAIFASFATCAATSPVAPMASRSRASNDVRTVTARISRPRASLWARSTARRSMAGPPAACTVSMRTPSAEARATARSTVSGMSWSFRSRNTWQPASSPTARADGPASTKSSSPTLNIPTASRTASAAARARSRPG